MSCVTSGSDGRLLDVAQSCADPCIPYMLILIGAENCYRMISEMLLAPAYTCSYMGVTTAILAGRISLGVISRQGLHMAALFVVRDRE